MLITTYDLICVFQMNALIITPSTHHSMIGMSICVAMAKIGTKKYTILYLGFVLSAKMAKNYSLTRKAFSLT